MKKSQIARQQGFTLIELMIVIAIVGILAAIALPAYQDYTVRARLSEALAVAAEGKTSIAEYTAANRLLPASALSAGIVENGFGVGSFVRLATFDGSGDPTGVYTITTSTAASLGPAADKTFQLQATRDPNSGRVTWQCGPGTAANTIDAKYLPGSCRDVF
jgi:type IV pilus assembly protein PilA